jgi:hypothetical protein
VAADAVRLGIFEDISASLNEEERHIKAQYLAIQKKSKWAEEVSSLLNSDQIVAATILIESQPEYLGTVLKNSVNETALKEYLSQLDEISRERAERFENDLPLALEQTGMRLDPTSRSPKYSLSNGFIKIEILPSKKEATIATRDCKPEKYPSDLETFVLRLKNIESRLFNNNWDIDNYCRQMVQIFEEAIEVSPGSKSVPAKEFQANCAKKFSIKNDEFNVLFSKILDQYPDSFYLENTRNSASGIMFYKKENLGAIGFIKRGSTNG